MLLGVSRQAVSKWEAERAYPEMDKLIKICQLFDCSLDDLVQGDLTHTTPAPQTVLPSTTQNQDVVGWDEHMRKFARTIAIGIFAAIFGLAVAAFIDGSISRVSSGDFWPGLDFSDPFAFIACCIGALVALACFIPTGIEHAAFNKAHPYIKKLLYRLAARSRTPAACARRDCRNWHYSFGSSKRVTYGKNLARTHDRRRISNASCPRSKPDQLLRHDELAD